MLQREKQLKDFFLVGITFCLTAASKQLSGTPATFQLHPSGCLQLCGGHHQYAPSLQQGDERPFEVRRDREDWYRREL